MVLISFLQARHLPPFSCGNRRRRFPHSAPVQADKEEAGCLVITGLRIVGAPGTQDPAAPGGISLFRAPKASAGGGAPTQSGAQRGAAGGDAVAAAEVFLAVHAEDMVSQVSVGAGFLEEKRSGAGGGRGYRGVPRACGEATRSWLGGLCKSGGFVCLP